MAVQAGREELLRGRGRLVVMLRSESATLGAAAGDGIGLICLPIIIQELMNLGSRTVVRVIVA